MSFQKQVRPGDQLRLEVEMTRVRGPIGKGKAIATVDGEIACEAEITFAIGDKKNRCELKNSSATCRRIFNYISFIRNIKIQINQNSCCK